MNIGTSKRTRVYIVLLIIIEKNQMDKMLYGLNSKSNFKYTIFYLFAYDNELVIVIMTVV